MFRVLCLCILAVFMTPDGRIAAQRVTRQKESNAGKILGISFYGLKRTKIRIAEQPLKKYLGRLASEVDLNEVRAAILTLGILEPVSLDFVEAPEGGFYLRAEVKEKWAILPLPMVFYSSSGELTAGAAFLDANAFGINEKFGAGGIYRTNGWIAVAFYDHASGREWVPGWNCFGMYSQELRIDTDQAEAQIRRFALDALSIRWGLNYRLSELFQTGLSLAYRDVALREPDSYPTAPDSGARVISIVPDISIRRNRWDGYLLSEQEASIRYAAGIGLDGRAFHSVSLTGTYEQSLVPGFRVIGKTGLRYDPEAPLLFESSPASAQVDILPQTYRARHYAGASLGLEKYLFKTALGTLSVHASYQTAYSQNTYAGNEFDHGAAGGIRFYMSKLAVPALGIIGAYNAAKNHALFSFSLGASF
jgi:hypothetical protein